MEFKKQIKRVLEQLADSLTNNVEEDFLLFTINFSKFFKLIVHQ
jgi:hypothetical protein